MKPGNVIIPPLFLMSHCVTVFFPWLLCPASLFASFPLTQRLMHISTLNRCSFVVINLICAFYPRCSGAWMTDFCLAVLREETRHPHFKGTIFSREGSKSGRGGGVGVRLCKKSEGVK